MSKLTKRDKKEAKRLIIVTLRFLIIVAIGFGIGFGGTYLVRYVNTPQVVTPPENPVYPSDADVGTDRFDNTTVATMDENQCVLTYEDNTIKICERATNEDVKFLNEHLSEATTSWINLHIGTCLICYTIDNKGTRYEFYQHLVDTEYVFLYKYELTDE